jgi:hypothetical protein
MLAFNFTKKKRIAQLKNKIGLGIVTKKQENGT